VRLYVAGPMTGLPRYNFPAFDTMAGLLRAQGHVVVSPAELDDPADRAAALASPDGRMHNGAHMGKTWGDFLARDVKLIADGGIEGIVVLPGWHRSRGARLETFVGFLCGLTIYRRALNAIDEPGLDRVSVEDLVSGWAGEDMMTNLMEALV
jgi:hypothetical protein